MATTIFLISLALLSSYCSANPSTTPNPKSVSTAHAALNSYGFPPGLLPANVLDYNLNGTSGSFSVEFGGACRFLLPPDNYLASFSKTVRGKIVSGRIAELDGIRVRALFQWWSITGIRSSGENLVFEVGMLSAKYPAKNFDESPQCEGQHSSS